MSEFLFENPFLIGGFAGILSVIAWYAFVQSGQPLARNLAIGMTLVTIALICLNVAIETDREIIYKTLGGYAKELQENQFEKLETRIHPDATEVVQATKALLPHLKVREARITRIHSVNVETVDGEKTAQVRMNVIVDADLRGYGFKTPRWVLLDLVEVDGRWLVQHLEHREPHYEIMGGD